MRCVCACVCVCPCKLHIVSVSLLEFVSEDLGPCPSIPGSQGLSIITFNDLHMGPFTAGYSNTPAYSNARASGFS